MTPEYLAGLFDGEGCIDVQRMYPQEGKERLYVRPRVRMCMANSSLLVMRMLNESFGGHLVHRKAGKRNQQASWSLEWLNNEAIRTLLGTILPHLILKAEQAKLALWWLDNMSGRARKRKGQQSEFAGIDQARAAFCEELRAMKVDPQRLSERAIQRIAGLMRQSDLYSDIEKVGESATSLALAS